MLSMFDGGGAEIRCTFPLTSLLDDSLDHYYTELFFSFDAMVLTKSWSKANKGFSAGFAFCVDPRGVKEPFVELKVEHKKNAAHEVWKLDVLDLFLWSDEAPFPVAKKHDWYGYLSTLRARVEADFDPPNDHDSEYLVSKKRQKRFFPPDKMFSEIMLENKGLVINKAVRGHVENRPSLLDTIFEGECDEEAGDSRHLVSERCSVTQSDNPVRGSIDDDEFQRHPHKLCIIL